jgi:hypothetical protein
MNQEQYSSQEAVADDEVAGGSREPCSVQALPGRATG